MVSMEATGTGLQMVVSCPVGAKFYLVPTKSKFSARRTALPSLWPHGGEFFRQSPLVGLLKDWTDALKMASTWQLGLCASFLFRDMSCTLRFSIP